ncbi:hypothetical protein C8Q78DRAFT_596346 [Trametes maxima]|nr:hypothetical protein C8Q78DRAFT_596346 [Trametes maxima]
MSYARDVDFDDVVRGVIMQRATDYTCLASITFMMWDILISLPSEITLVWQKPKGWLRFLYVFIRYVPLLSAITSFIYFSFPGRGKSTNEQCQVNSIVEEVVLACVVVTVHVILIPLIKWHVPVYALYNRSRILLRVLAVGCAITLCASLLGEYFASSSYKYGGTCLLVSAPRTMLPGLAWLSPATFDLILFILTLIKFYESRREGLSRLPILDTIMRDGTWAFLLSFVVMILNTLVYTRTITTEMSGIAYACTMSSLSYIGSQVLLNLKRVLAQPSCLPWDSSSSFTDSSLDWVGSLPSWSHPDANEKP